MYKKLKILLSVSLLFSGITFSQDLGHGDILYRARNNHAGNLIRVTYHNHGMLGAIRNDNSLVYGGEWPINSGLVQMGNASSFVGSEIRVFSHIDSINSDSVYLPITPIVFSQGWDPNRFSRDSLGNFLGFEPLPGFYNIDNPDQFQKSAMSHMPLTWPLFWPDKTLDAADAGWEGSWNGYFGKNIFSADQESYHVLDDYNFKKKVTNYSLPQPLAFEADRGGLGLRKYIRGLQWANPSAEDAIFWIYTIENIGDLTLNKTNFGLNIGASIGAIIGTNNDWLDDAATFYRETALTVNFDYDNVGTGGYSPVPWVGFAFLESPGNAFDGIDNDGDGIEGDGTIISSFDFFRIIAESEDVVLIDYDSGTYERTVIAMPDTGITFKAFDKKYTKLPNSGLVEIERNGIDDNLNGIIDEADGAKVAIPGSEGDSASYFLYLRDEVNNKQDYLSKNYITGEGLGNLMIDERRDDGIDNDGDWDPLVDDVGLDGAEATQDEGEGDGIPTSGRDGLPGENNFDRVDVSESDQIGLTSFIFYEYGVITYSDDNQVWNITKPGFFDGQLENVDADYIFATGYFPLLPGQTEAFSVGMVYGWDEEDILRNKDVVQVIYDANYNFAVAPLPPIVTAVAGDKKVTLNWGYRSEQSKDRFLREYDFEGYKIYRATDPGFQDAGAITDGYGSDRYTKPIASFDKINGISGFFPLTDRVGVQYNLGTETGLVHTFVDSPVVNGQRYFYAVSAFDRGSEEDDITPTENNKFVTINANGDITTGSNVAVVTPSAPALGYIPPEFDNKPERVGGNIDGTAKVLVNIVDSEMFTEDQEFELEFWDVSMDSIDNDGDGLIDTADVDEFLPTETSAFVLHDITDPLNPIVIDTVLIKDMRLQTKTIATDSGEVRLDTVVSVINLYDDADRNPRTFTASINGMEIFVYNPEPSILNSDDGSAEYVNGVKWSNSIDRDLTYNLRFGLLDNPAFLPGVFAPRQLMIVFDDEAKYTSKELFITRTTGSQKRIKESPSNFKVLDALTNEEVPYAFAETYQGFLEALSYAPPNHFSAKDEIYFFEELANGENLITFYTAITSANDSTDFINHYGRTLGTGDTLYLFTDSQYSNKDRFRFKAISSKVDNEIASASLGKIRVVPNPYVVTNRFEPKNPFSSGRGPRKIYFTNLPQKCTIRIYSVDGTYINKIEHDDQLGTVGTAEWDLLTKDEMDVAYGLYIYHVNAPGIGEKTGRFILIK